MTRTGLTGSRVLITGGAGLIGSHIADRLLLEGVQKIVILDNFVRGRWENLQWALDHGPVIVVEGDVRDQKMVEKVMQGIDYVFHQAAIRITQCAEEPRLALEVLVDGTFNVCEAAVREGVKKIVAASSASIYGLADIFPTQETHHPYNNRTLYGAGKLFNEGLLRSFHEQHGLSYVALRYFNVFGPRMDIHGAYTEVMIRWMERLAAQSPPLIFGAGEHTMDFVYVEDVARANILAAKSPVTDEVINIGSGTETSLRELALVLCRIMHTSDVLEHGPPRTVNGVTRRMADTTRARDLLNFETQFSLEDGLQKLVSWWTKERLPVFSPGLVP